MIPYRLVQLVFFIPCPNPVQVYHCLVSLQILNHSDLYWPFWPKNTFRPGIESSSQKKKEKKSSPTGTDPSSWSTLVNQALWADHSLNRRPSLFISLAADFFFFLRNSGWETFVMWYEKEARVLEYYIMSALYLDVWMKFKEHRTTGNLFRAYFIFLW